MDTTKLIPDAEPGEDFYYAVVRTSWADTRASISHCPHRHQTRESAERCAVRLVASIRRIESHA